MSIISCCFSSFFLHQFFSSFLSLFLSLLYFLLLFLLFVSLSSSSYFPHPLSASAHTDISVLPLTLLFLCPGETVSLVDVDISRRGGGSLHPPTPPPPPRRSLSLLGTSSFSSSSSAAALCSVSCLFVLACPSSSCLGCLRLDLVLNRFHESWSSSDPLDPFSAVVVRTELDPVFLQTLDFCLTPHQPVKLKARSDSEVAVGRRSSDWFCRLRFIFSSWRSEKMETWWRGVSVANEIKFHNKSFPSAR